MSIFDKNQREILYHIVHQPVGAPVPEEEHVVEVFPRFPANINRNEDPIELDQTVPVIVHSSRTVLLEEAPEEHVVPNEVVAENDVQVSDPDELVYHKVLRTVMTSYDCYNSQYVRIRHTICIIY